MKVLKWILIVVVAIVAIALIYSASQPNTMSVSSSVVINAPASKVYQEVMNYATWNQWATWNMKDPDMKVEYSGEPGQVGYKSSWSSTNQEVGVGSQEVVELTENEFIKVAMNFEGWDGTSYANWQFEAVDGGTKTTWGFEGSETPFYLNWMNAMMASMIEVEYVASLKNLKDRVESMADEVANPMNLEIIELEPMPILSIKDSCSAADIGPKLAELYGELSVYIAATDGVEMVDMPFALYHAYSEEKVVLEAAMKYSGEPSASGRIVVRETPGGNAVKGVHMGDYNLTGGIHNAIEAYVTASGLEYNGPCWEVYTNDPTTVDSADVETHIIYPVL